MTTILLLEDDLVVRQLSKSLLKKRNVSCHEAATIVEGERILKEFSIDIIVVDGELKDTTFEETCRFVREIRANGFNGLMIAASSSADMREILIENGCNYNIVECINAKRGAINRLLELLDAADEKTYAQ
jgi:DNA-binding response OmpR family regulator